MIHVLVIDDEPAVRMLLQRNLEFAGFEVETAEDGGQGLLAVRRGVMDVVVLDLMMPHVDGFQVLAELSAPGSTVTAPPVIILTALSDPSVKARCFEAGASSVMTKPFDPFALTAEITRLVGAEHQPQA
jgi:DNA-binding response OmpR family regulator